MEPTVVAAIVIVIIIILITIPIVIMKQKRQAKVWEKIAAELGLTLRPRSNSLAPIVIEGQYLGRQVILDIETRTGNENENSATFTRVEMTVSNPLQIAMNLHKEGVGDKFSKALGGTDIQVGDPGLDKKLRIGGDPDVEIIRVLTSPDVRSRMLGEPQPTFFLNSSQLHWKGQGVVNNASRFREVLDLMTSIAAEVGR